MPSRPRSFASWALSCSVLYLISCSKSTHPVNTVASPLRDSVAVERDSLARLVRQLIAGRESEPATKVFENVQVLTENVSAANLIQAMTFYGSALGVGCSHCHAIDKWASDEKPKKSVARAMMRMNGVINGQLLKNISGLRSPNPSVNCVTCHRGQVVPARSLR